MALFEVVLKSIFAGQQCVNRWNYLGAGTPAAVSLSLGLTSAMGFIAAGTPPVFPSGTIFDKIRAITSEDVEFNEVIVMSIYDDTDFYTTAFPDNTLGFQGDPAAPPIDAMGFRTNLVTRAVSRGTKRFVGIPKSVIGSNGQIDAGHIVNMAVLGGLMAAPITYDDEGNTLTYNPVIVSKEKYTTPSGKFAYKYYSSLTVQLSHVAQGFTWEVYDTVRSQTSRQIGKGN